MTVTTKKQMYRLLDSGEFGNTIPQWLDPTEWANSDDAKRFRTWGVRTMTPGGPCRLNCPASEVVATATAFQKSGHRPQISMMVDAVSNVTAWLEVWESDTGLVVEGIEYPNTSNGWTWRNSMPDPSKRCRWEGIEARSVLRRHLNPNDLDDLSATLTRFPGHVVELSALDRCLGIVPHRNAVVWEVRNY